MEGEQKLKALEGMASEPLVDDRPPLTSPVTLQVAFALAGGYRFFAADSFLDAIEKLSGGELRRQVVWGFDAAHTVEWEGEPWTVKRYVERLIDPDWREARPRHPVARLGAHYAAAAAEKASERADFLARAVEGQSGRIADLVRAASHTYLGYRWKIQAGLDGVTEHHPEFKAPLERHVIVRQGHSRAYLRMNATPEERAADLSRYGMTAV